MPVSFVHLSDIHFGQERGAEVIVHDDVKERLLEDAAQLVRAHCNGCASGVIVTGDIAYAGESDQYRIAGEWLDRLTHAIGCPRTAVQVVPGNHDIDRKLISAGCKWMLEQVVAEGEPKLDSFLEREVDRDVFYERFAAYLPFAEGYDCPLDRNGGGASSRTYELAPNRVLRFIGLNSALVCSAEDKEGSLLLGARQHVLPKKSGEELVVLCHHPLHWLRDSENARPYVRNRARVFVSGHEHKPSLKVDAVKNGCDLMMLSAGATTPPKEDVDAGYKYTYNLLTFDLEPSTEYLRVTVVPRVWSQEDTEFIDDVQHFPSSERSVVLGCPNFRSSGEVVSLSENSEAASPYDVTEAIVLKNGTSQAEAREGDVMADPFPLLLLRFFRDLTPSQRIAVLVKLKALPSEWNGALTHVIERRVVDAVAGAGRLEELEAEINSVQGQNT